MTMTAAVENAGTVVIKCPVCGYFAAKLSGEMAGLEVNCTNTRCHTTILVRKDGPTVNVTAKPHLPKR